MSPLRTVDRQRLSDIAFDRLKDAIIKGDIGPGEKVRDADLALRLGLSRTPVREALNRLVEIGLAESKPGSYTKITPLTQQSVSMTLAVLQPLDHLAVKTAVPNLRLGDIAELRRVNQDLASAIELHQLDAALVADYEFHRILRGAAGNPVLTRVISQLDPHIQRILHRKFSTILGSRNTIHHHDTLITMCEAGDADSAAELSAAQWSVLGGQINELFGPESVG